MYTEGFDQWLKNANKNFAPVGDWQKSSTEIWRQLAVENLEMLSENLMRLSDQLNRVAHIKKPEDYMTLMRECFNEDMNATIENSQKLMRSTMEHLQECAKSSVNLQESTIKSTTKEREKEREREK